MLERLSGELGSIWEWLCNTLGWDVTNLTWVHWLVIALALVGALIILRNLIGGHSGGGGSANIYPSAPTSMGRGFPTSFYTADRKVGNFSVPKEVYDFKVLTSTPKLNLLRQGVNLDMEKARELFVPAGPLTKGLTANLKPGDRDSGGAEKSSSVVGDASGKDAGEGERSVAADGSGTSQPATSPNWELASKLFIPRIRRSR